MIGFCQGMEGAIAQDSENPSSSEADRSFDNGLILRASHTGWYYRHIKMAGHLCKAWIEVRLIRRGFRNDGLWVVGNTDFWASLKEGEGERMSGAPSLAVLVPEQLCVCVGAGTERADKQVCWCYFARSFVDNAQGGAGKVRECLFPSLMILSHYEIDSLTPLPVNIAELRLLVAFRMILLVLFPEQS